MTTLAPSAEAVGRSPRSTITGDFADAARRVCIGPVNIEVIGDGGGAADDFAHLYRDWLDSQLPGPVIRVQIRQVGARRWRRRYAIDADGETIFDDLSPGEVFPYLEWAINYRVIAGVKPFLQLHAATLAWRGRGVMLVGESGSGKSSLTAVLAARGWDYMSDEFALIEPNTLRLHAFPKALCVKAGSFDLVRGLGMPLWRRRHWVKALKGRVGYVSPHDLQVGTRPVPVRLVVFPRYAGGRSLRLYPMERSRAAFALAANAFNRADFGDRTPVILGAVVGGAECLVVEPGAAETTAAALEAVLDRT